MSASTYLAALGWTIVIEVPIYVVVLGPLARRLGAAPWPWTSATMFAVVVDVVSHPIAFLALRPALRTVLGPTAALAVVEVAVLLFEAFAVFRVRRDPFVAVIASALANLGSLSIGMLMFG